MAQITSEMIESLVFNPISIDGCIPYRLKKVEVSHPLQNVAGYIQIDNNYYKKINTIKFVTTK